MRAESVHYVLPRIDSKIIPPTLPLRFNIGSGVRWRDLRISLTDEGESRWASQRDMGGGTFWGPGFSFSMQVAKVRDIYGGAYDALKLPGDLTASSFGKTVRSPRDDHHDGLLKQFLAYGTLNVRSFLLDVREQYLNECSFPDPYAEVKQEENEAALLLLSKRLKDLDALPWETTTARSH
ncbi:Pantothenate kinase 4 [Desmophyllum pertusum]|uniref:Pantothenate kinase 4 n=1 Tax=Desmophyllum pertusum TaxID=174260 RepID=A0A9W9ZAZ9_9CNID|nr:Pantothenate kinase 4 [Desmophyllum pertusum]